MQYRPTAAELLDTIAALLEVDVLPAVGGGLQHQVRVGANLARILQREAELGPAAAERERQRLQGLLGRSGTLDELRNVLAEELRRPGDAAGFERAAWDVLVATAREDLAIAKPGHDGWEGD